MTTSLPPVQPVPLWLSTFDWLTFRETPWMPDKNPIAAEGCAVNLLHKYYYLKRRDGLPISINLVALPGDAALILGDLEIQATRALRSYEGCGCTWTQPCKAHIKPVDVNVFRGVPDYMQTSAGLREWLEARNGYGTPACGIGHPGQVG